MGAKFRSNCQMHKPLTEATPPHTTSPSPLPRTQTTNRKLCFNKLIYLCLMGVAQEEEEEGGTGEGGIGFEKQKLILRVVLPVLI